MKDIGKSINFAQKFKNKNLSNEDLKDIYNEEIKRKEILEDKAKTNIIGVTIAVTLMTGASSLLKNISGQYNNYIYIASIFIFIVAVFYMLRAGIIVMHVIIGENEVYQLNPDLVNDFEPIRLNQLKNIIRNNYVYTSYICIRNSLICLFVVMVLAVFPFNSVTANNKYHVISNHNNFYYPDSSIDTLQSGLNKKQLENDINGKIANGVRNNHKITFVDNNQKVVIRFKVKNKSVTVYSIEKYIE